MLKNQHYYLQPVSVVKILNWLLRHTVPNQKRNDMTLTICGKVTKQSKNMFALKLAVTHEIEYYGN